MDNLAVHIPTLDLGYLTAQTEGDDALERQLLSLFRAQALHILSRLKSPALGSAQENADFTHLLKGSALAIGATRVAAMAAAYESLAASPNPGPPAAALAALDMAVADAVAAIERHIGPPP